MQKCWNFKDVFVAKQIDIYVMENANIVYSHLPLFISFSLPLSRPFC